MKELEEFKEEEMCYRRGLFKNVPMLNQMLNEYSKLSNLSDD
jgi:hypothetical protein